MLKALSLGAKAVGIGRYYPSMAAAGQADVSGPSACSAKRTEREMKLMGCTAISQLSRDNLRFR